jgi:hypothetical protein
MEVEELPEPVTLQDAEDTNLPLLSTRSALNARYVSRDIPAGQSEDSATGRRTATLKSTGPDMDRWLENVFNQALNGSSDDADHITLSRRMKGGGDKKSQVSIEQRSNNSITFFSRSVNEFAFSAASNQYVLLKNNYELKITLIIGCQFLTVIDASIL